MAQQSPGVVKRFSPENVLFINFLTNITVYCDCWGMSTASLVPDIGILASLDPVAIDKASVDLINSKLGLAGTAIGSHIKEGDDKIAAIEGRGIEWEHQLKYAEELGLGSRKYELIRL